MRACDHCPWRRSNQGLKTPGGWYTKKNLRRLWTRLRRGESMSCHPTDPRMNHDDEACPPDYRPAAPGTEVRECMGALILQQREVMRVQAMNDPDDPSSILAYFRGRRPGLTRQGLAAVYERALFAGALGGKEMPKPDLSDDDVYYEPLAEESP